MKRTCLISSALALSVLAPTLASAEPAILYIPTEAVTLRPTSMAPCGSAVNSALGCGGASEETEEPPYDDAAALTTAMSDALATYDVLVTNTRPPEYISYTMLLASEEPAEKSESFTCAFGSINCSARQRNDIISTSGTTMFCMDPEVTHAALYAFGRTSGLEGITNPEDYMNYVPDYTTPPTGYQDVCSDRVQQFQINDDGDQVMVPFECTSVDHFECPDGANMEPGQNSHQDLLLVYGERLSDTDAPVLANIVPENGAVLNEGDDLALDVDITDADTVVGARWIVSSPALMDAGIEGGTLSQCTNDVCDANWDDATPLKATDSDWAFTLAGLPRGEYTITLEAADYHGNVAETVTVMVTIEGGGTDETAGPADTGADETAGPADTGNDSSVFTSGQATDDGDDTEGGTGAVDDGADGCSCRTSSIPGQTPGGAVLMFLGLMGLGAMRRRW
jgi:MYXO-CTERM domain-containing protein